MHLKNDRLLKAIWQQPVDATPIWIMRQAGRYLPEYQKTRAQAGSFMQLCQTPELACEVTLQPIHRYPLDAAIIFSDILTIPDAMGLQLSFIEQLGPVFKHTISNLQDIQRLPKLDIERLDYVYEAIRLVSKELAGHIPLIGFCGSPWTLAAYMIEGRSQPGFPKIKAMQAKEPEMLHHLLNHLAEAVCDHLNAQIAAGANVVMIFDTWGGLLENELNYHLFSSAYIQKIAAGLKRKHYNKEKSTPLIVFTKGGGRWLNEIAKTGCEALGLDWEISLAEARQMVGMKAALQGNMHPEYLLKHPDAIREEVKRILASYGCGSGHVFNLGHGITPDVPPEHVRELVDAVHEYSIPYH